MTEGYTRASLRGAASVGARAGRQGARQGKGDGVTRVAPTSHWGRERGLGDFSARATTRVAHTYHWGDERGLGDFRLLGCARNDRGAGREMPDWEDSRDHGSSMNYVRYIIPACAGLSRPRGPGPLVLSPLDATNGHPSSPVRPEPVEGHDRPSQLPRPP